MSTSNPEKTASPANRDGRRATSPHSTNAREESFPEIFRTELGAIGKDVPADLGNEELYQLALDNRLIGLAFSGGGIRSATFNLGVLQGLADCTQSGPDDPGEVGEVDHPRQARGPGLLSCLNYLSSVSGGGYISGWLAAWVLRDGELKNVERQLRPNRHDQAEANRSSSSVAVSAEKQAATLKLHSAYELVSN